MLELALDEWAAALGGFSADQVERGIAGVRLHCQWPPSIAEFVGYAKADDRLMGSGYCDFVALPRPNQSPEVVKAALNGMRKALKICR